VDDEDRLISLQKGFDDVTSGLSRLEIFTKQKLEELAKLVWNNSDNNNDSNDKTRQTNFRQNDEETEKRAIGV